MKWRAEKYPENGKGCVWPIGDYSIKTTTWNSLQKQDERGDKRSELNNNINSIKWTTTQLTHANITKRTIDKTQIKFTYKHGDDVLGIQGKTMVRVHVRYVYAAVCGWCGCKRTK